MRLFLSIFALLFAHCIPQDVIAQDSPGREKVGSGNDEDPCGGSTAVTFDGHTYALVGIGTQCWFKENLRSDNYRNGDGIPGNLADSQWTTTTSGAQTVYGEGTSEVVSERGRMGDEVGNLLAYGRLYNWYAVIDVRGLCPDGFHVPSDADWTVLENWLGGPAVSCEPLRSTEDDSPPWDGSNSSGFSALPGGYRQPDHGSFSDMWATGLYWSSTSSGSNACLRALISGYSSVWRREWDRRNGFSVRCLKD